MPAHFTALSGPLTGEVLKLSRGSKWTLGRDPDLANLPLEDSTVSREHAKVRKTKEGFFIQNLSAVNPVLVNDEPIEEEHLLQEGDRIKIGQTVFVFSLGKTGPSQDLYSSIFEEEEEEAEKETTPLFAEENENPYSTIFDDAAAEEEPISLHFSSPSPLLLKVLLGPNTGAEFGLDKSRSYLLGKDPITSDILFQDLSVSKNHARLTVDVDGNATLEDLDSKNGTLINNQPIKEITSITSHDLITLGTTSFVVINRGESLETVYALPEFETRAPHKATPSLLETAPSKPQNWREQIIPFRYLAIAGASLLILFGTTLSFFSLFRAEHIKPITRDFHKEIAEKLTEFEGVSFSYNPGANKLFLSGHVLTSTDQMRLLYDLSALTFIHDIENRIVIDEQVWKNMNDLLSSHADWKGVKIFSPKAGEFVVSGYLNTPNEAASLAEFLTLNFPYTDLLKNQAVVEELLDTQIQSLLLARGFEGLSFQMSVGELILAGMYPEDQNRAFNKLLEDLKKIRGINEIKNLSIPTNADSARIDLSDKYIISGMTKREGKEFNAVVNGRIIGIGDLIDGMRITDLKSDMVLLERNGIRYKIVANR